MRLVPLYGEGGMVGKLVQWSTELLTGPYLSYLYLTSHSTMKYIAAIFDCDGRSSPCMDSFRPTTPACTLHGIRLIWPKPGGSHVKWVVSVIRVECGSKDGRMRGKWV